MRTFVCAVVVTVSFLATAGCSGPKPESLWDRHCHACHDGRTVLNGKVVINREEMKEKYRGKSLQDFVDACGESTTCMNILKHNEDLLREVGKEMGIGASGKK